MKTKTFKQVTLKNGQVIKVGDIVRDKKFITGFPYKFQVKGIFISTQNTKCFYMQNSETKQYYGNSDEVNNYKKVKL